MSVNSAPAEDGQCTALLDVVVSAVEVLLVLKEVVFRSRFRDVDEMIRHRLPVNDIVFEVLARADVHTAVYLS